MPRRSDLPLSSSQAPWDIFDTKMKCDISSAEILNHNRTTPNTQHEGIIVTKAKNRTAVCADVPATPAPSLSLLHNVEQQLSSVYNYCFAQSYAVVL